MGLEPPRQHPLGLVLLGRDETDRILREALRRLLGFDQRLESIFVLVDIDQADPIDRLLDGRHSSLRCGFKVRGLDLGVWGPDWFRRSPSIASRSLGVRSRAPFSPP